MDIEFFRAYCLNKVGTTEEFPFDDKTLVFKVMDKVYALCRLESDPMQVNLKCDPDRAEDLRDSYTSVIPGYHMNKKHWNTLVMDGDIPFGLFKELIDHSYELVCNKLSKKTKLILVKKYEES
ncbi:MAG: MmcQ/YjbR family DNA-binding protein [Saprospiraceae bacterium]|nr:MmcQ/YjbR family DNA-binding protein [Saprospiraceae bacterium]